MKKSNQLNQDKDRPDATRATVVGRVRQWATAAAAAGDSIGADVLKLLQICGELADLIPEAEELRGRNRMLGANNCAYRRELARLRELLPA